MNWIRYVICVVVVFYGYCEGAEAQKKKTVCLNMIVKNESKVIERCITSLLPIIDYWVIVDTGSTDGTQDVIKKFMKEKGIPGELHERPWKNFAHNRNEAMDLAQGKSDYLFFIDADEYLVYEPGFKFPDLDKDYYYVTISYSGTKYGKIQMVNNHKDWRYIGVLHEVICPPGDRTSATLQNVLNIYTTEGARSRDPQKYQKDAKVLEDALKEEPDNIRYMFYLAQSYRDAGEYEKGIEWYKKRAEKGGWDQEVMWSWLQIGVMQEMLKKPSSEIVESYRKAFIARPVRAEPIFQMASYYRKLDDFESGYKIAKLGMSIPLSQDVLFVQHWMYDYGLPLEFSICAYWTGRYEECQQASLYLLSRKDLPSNIRDCVERNLGFTNSKLLEKNLEAIQATKTSNETVFQISK